MKPSFSRAFALAIFVALTFVFASGLIDSEARAQPCNPAVQTCT